ncbi:hypothetical protein [Streptomyces sp. NPDC018000]|uniref:hypothetical protein n=1 Tax=Streptomyces sp. NPDC018000 TaxID=3365028 RepID=UPI0037A1D8F7
MLITDALSYALETGEFLGARIGMRPADVEERLGSGVRQVHGRGPNRFLRIDFGLAEATFGGEPDWACQWLSIHPHRIDSMPELAAEIREQYGLVVSGPVTWGQLSSSARAGAAPTGPCPPDRQVRYRADAVRATVQLSPRTGGDELSRVIEKISIGI